MPARWDDRIHFGTHREYLWLVSRGEISGLPQLAKTAHTGLRLCITAFDGGVIHPGENEISPGWTMQGDVMISPPLSASLAIPRDQCDEWYLLLDPDFTNWDGTRFVRFGGFTLADTGELIESFDATWDKHALDYLAPLQDRFWKEIEEIKPASYIAMGDRDIVVSRNQAFIDAVMKLAAI